MIETMVSIYRAYSCVCVVRFYRAELAERGFEYDANEGCICEDSMESRGNASGGLPGLGGRFYFNAFDGSHLLFLMFSRYLLASSDALTTKSVKDMPASSQAKSICVLSSGRQRTEIVSVRSVFCFHLRKYSLC